MGGKQAEPNSLVDEHAGRVASIMISRDKRQTGVAPNASLYSAAIDSTTGGGGQDHVAAWRQSSIVKVISQHYRANI